MARMVGTPEEYYFIDIGTTTTPNVLLFEYATQLDESPAAVTNERSYVSNKSATVLTTGYQTSFPFNIDVYTPDAVSDFIRSVGEEQKIGVTCPFYIVRLHQKESENVYYARMFTVGIAVDSITHEAGANIQVSGNLNAIGDVVIGTFNTTTKAFTPN